MQKLIDGLRHFQDHMFWESRELFERAVSGQRPSAMLITCSDSRVLPERIMQAEPGDLFVSRNAGNVVPPPDAASGEAATIEYAVRVLAVTDFVICGHYRCGAVQALLHPGECQGLPKTSEWLSHAAGTREAVERDHPELHGDALWDKAVEHNVLLQVHNLAKHPAVAAALAERKARLHAWVLRFETNELLAYDPLLNEFRPLLEMPSIQPTIPPPEASGNAVDDAPLAPPCQMTSSPSWGESLKSDLPASLVVFAVALPLCVAIAKACGVPTAAGIITAIVGGVVVGLLGGGPLQVSGPTAGLIVVLLGVGERLGLDSLGIVVLLAGLMQIAAGLLRLGQWFRAVSPVVVLGMLAGIGVVLVVQQLHVTVDDLPNRSPIANVLTIPRAAIEVFHGHPGHPGHVPAAAIGLLTLSVLLVWTRMAPGRLKAIPAVLAAMIVATTAATLLRLPVQRVEFDRLISGVVLFDFAKVPALIADPTVWQLALTVALLASAETLLTAAAVDALHVGARTRYNRELAAQGIGNAICGLLGVLPLAGVIVRSSANVQAGAKTRWASICHGVWLLAFVLVMPQVLRLIPTATLAAALVLTGAKLIQFRAIRVLWSTHREEALICIATAVTVVVADLLTGVMIGVGLSLAKLIHAFSTLRIHHRGDLKRGTYTLVLDGSATFLRLPQLASALEAIPTGAVLRIDSKSLSYIDHTCLTLLMNWQRRHEVGGGTLDLDWTTVHARSQAARPRPHWSRPPRNSASL